MGEVCQYICHIGTQWLQPHVTRVLYTDDNDTDADKSDDNAAQLH